MKQAFIYYILIILTACNSDKKQDAKFKDTINQTLFADTTSNEKKPEKTVISFLKWYRDNLKNIHKIELVNNSNNVVYDSTKFYSVNFDNTEIYLSKFKNSGYVSDKYIGTWRLYFKQCESNFKTSPENDGPPSGFDFDFVMCSQEYDEDLANIDKVKIENYQADNTKAKLTLEFPSNMKLSYWLTKQNGNWLIDDIQNKIDR